jgi:hypothetical protein
VSAHEPHGVPTYASSDGLTLHYRTWVSWVAARRCCCCTGSGDHVSASTEPAFATAIVEFLDGDRAHRRGPSGVRA